MDPNKPDSRDLHPPKAIRSAQELAARITGSAAMKKMQAQAEAINKLNAESFAVADTLGAAADTIRKIQGNYPDALERIRRQAEMLEGFQVPDYLTDLSSMVPGHLHSEGIRALLGSSDRLMIDPSTAPYLQSISTVMASFSDSEINRTIRKLGLLVAETEGQGRETPDYNEVHQSLDRLREATTADEFLRIFAASPAWVRNTMYLFFQLCFHFLIAVSANLAAHEVQALLDRPDLSQREKIAHVRSAPLGGRS